jgi:enamine deaminase RidA (YjgF/YER057c/UK114 family)
MRRRISSGSAFETQIGYCRAVVDGRWVHVSGCTGYDYATMSLAGTAAAQAEQAMRNIETALAEAGASITDVVRVRYLVADRADFESCWPALRRRFAASPPAATMMVCGLLDPEMKIEIEATAHMDRDGV